MVRVDLTAGLIGAACVRAWMQLAANRIFLFQFVILKFREELSYGQAVSKQRHRPAALQLGSVINRVSVFAPWKIYPKPFLSISPKFLKNADFAEKVLTSTH